MMYRTELVEGITVENVTEKINAKIEEMEKESYRLVTMSFWGTERAVLVVCFNRDEQFIKIKNNFV